MSDPNDTRRPLKVEVDVEFEGYSGREHHADALLYPKGLLLRTRYLKAVGTNADFEVFVVEGEPPLKGRGPVVFSRWQDQGPRRPAGLGLRVDEWLDDSAARAAQWFDEPQQSLPDSVDPTDVVSPDEVDAVDAVSGVRPTLASSPSAPVSPADSAARLAEIEASLGLAAEARRARERSDLDALGESVVEGGEPFRAVWDPGSAGPESSADAASAAAGGEPFRPVWTPPADLPPISTSLAEAVPSLYESSGTTPGTSPGLGGVLSVPALATPAAATPAPVVYRPTVSGMQRGADDVPSGRDGDVVWAPASSRGRFLPWIGLGLAVGALIAGGYWVYVKRTEAAAPIVTEPTRVTRPTPPAPAPPTTPAASGGSDTAATPAGNPTAASSTTAPSAPGAPATTAATAPSAPASPAPAQVVAAGERFHGVAEIRVDRDGDGLAVVIELDGSIQARDFQSFRLDAPPREVIRLSGVTRPFTRGRITVGDALLTTVRTGEQPGNALQIVLDLAGANVRAEAPRIDGRRLIVRLR
jgi:hypothetical protein